MATENYALTIRGLVGTEYVENVLCFQGVNLTANATLTNSASLINAWGAHVQSQWLALFPPDYALDGYSCRRIINLPSATTVTRNSFFALTGTGSGLVKYSQLCPCVLILPPMGIKSAGKVFLPCVGDSSILNNQYVSGYITAVITAFSTMLAGIADGSHTWTLAIHSRKLNSVVVGIGARLSPRFGFQRRRKLPV